MSSILFPLRQDPGEPRPAGKAGAGLRPPASGDQPPSTGAWKREMERAQLNTWFKPRQTPSPAQGQTEGAAGGAASNSGGPQPAPLEKALQADGRTARPGSAVRGPAPDRAPGMPAPALIAAFPPKPEAGRMVASDIRLTSLAVALAAVSRMKVMGLAPGPVDPAEVMAQAFDLPAGPAGRSEEPGQPAIRLHAEWHGQDVVVWLGISALDDAVGGQVAQLLPQIRACLQEQRSRLVKLVCNGQTVFEVSSSFIPTFPYFTQPKEFP